MDEAFRVKAGRIINDLKGPGIGITMVKNLTDIIAFCKNIDETYMFPIPKKEVVTDWTFTDWCEYIDLTWSNHGSSKNTFDS